MHRILALLLLFALCAQPQSAPPPGAGGSQPAPTPRRSFFRSRKFLAVLGGAVAGTGAVLLATGWRTRQVPAANCTSSAAMVLVPCIPAHTQRTRSGTRDGVGGGLLVGGFVLVYNSMR